MDWYDYVAHAFAALFLVNSLPHLIAGLTGRPFPSPFSSPPGRGDSPPVVNVMWGSFNLAVVWLLLWLSPIPANWPLADKLIMAAAAFVTAVGLANFFSRPRV
ncbi:MAG: hypothetical protein KIS96_01110 [Bauldia sp.]|nr:hypothetical protein [Bauldia sp.]